jgi:hypothetical protein
MQITESDRFTYLLSEDGGIKNDIIVVDQLFRYKYRYNLNNKQVLVYEPFIYPAKDIRLIELFPFIDMWIADDAMIATTRNGDMVTFKIHKDAMSYIQRNAA